ncbi:MAG TPA: copper transporter, partial [Actinomycetota bacterium]|nr:copper transporter [Actinomycetota bacterium]
TETVDIAELNGVRQALRDAGAQVAGVLLATSRMALTDDNARQDMAELLQLASSLPPGDLVQQAAARLGTRLAEGPGLDPNTDILRDLRSARFLLAQSAPLGLDGIGGGNQGFVVLAGGRVPLMPSSRDFFLPLITSLNQSGRPVAAGEAEDNVDQFVTLVRQDAALAARVVTVDDADSMPGRVALVLGLERLYQGDLAGCHSFGVKPGACGLLPQAAASPSP